MRSAAPRVSELHDGLSIGVDGVAVHASAPDSIAVASVPGVPSTMQPSCRLRLVRWTDSSLSAETFLRFPTCSLLLNSSAILGIIESCRILA